MSGGPEADALAIGLDVGGTKILACVVSPHGVVLDRLQVATPSTASGIEDSLGACVAELRSRHPTVNAVGLAVAGWIAPDRRTISFSPHLPWRDSALAVALEERTGLRVTLENDANAATWGEAQFGAGRGVDDLVLITVGSGVGTGIVAGGQLLRGSSGMAGELGHTTVVPDGPPCPCGRSGCLDMYSSGRALVRRAQELGFAASGDQHPVGTATGQAVTQAARNGDPVALGAFGDIAGWLARGLADIVMILNPAVIILSGGVATAGDLLRTPLESRLTELLALPPGAEPEVRIAALGYEAGAVGAADLARGGEA